MYIENNTIFFKSFPQHYLKEKRGIKPNTMRIMSDSEDKLIQISPINYIYIEDSCDGDSFVRALTDITRFTHDNIIYYIFSWTHAP